MKLILKKGSVELITIIILFTLSTIVAIGVGRTTANNTLTINEKAQQFIAP